MNKQQLTTAIYQQVDGLTQKQAKQAIDVVLATMQNALADGEDITLVGFGVLAVKQRKARIGRNPKTHEPINIPAQKTVVFKAGKGLKQAVN